MNNPNKRIKYGFKLDWPAKPFTIRSLTTRGAHPQYITAYMRIKNGLKTGEIVKAGEKTPTETRRGRKELVFVRADAKQSVLTAAVLATA